MGGLLLSASDVRAIADALEPIETNEFITENPVIGRIEVIRPDGDDVVGYFEREGTPNGSGEAWFGFRAVSD
jgi:hypothetical protein